VRRRTLRRHQPSLRGKNKQFDAEAFAFQLPSSPFQAPPTVALQVLVGIVGRPSVYLQQIERHCSTAHVLKPLRDDGVGRTICPPRTLSPDVRGARDD
jgi:hypothetical protein